jgi:hypothetical protein
MTKLTKEQSADTVTKKMIRTVMDYPYGTRYGHHKTIKESIREAIFELDNDKNFQEMCYYDRTTSEKYLYKNTRKIEENLRKKGLRIWGDR